jgi:hypothetical protein
VVGAGAIAHLSLDDAARSALEGGAHFEVIDPRDPPTGVRVGTRSRAGDRMPSAHPGGRGADLAHVPSSLR